MNNIFRRRNDLESHDDKVRSDTKNVLLAHRRTLSKVRSTLSSADETLADEIRRLDDVLEKR